MKLKEFIERLQACGDEYMDANVLWAHAKNDIGGFVQQVYYGNDFKSGQKYVEIEVR